MRELEDQLCRQLLETSVKDCRLLVGVSGGADSIALLRSLMAVQDELSLELMVGHVDHGVRDTSSEDALWVAERCADWGVPIETRCVRVLETADRTSAGIEETARRVRYELLTEIAASRRCQFLAVGHTADDQAETILHHLLRGTGLGGLRGMPAVRDLGSGVRLIRPLLTIRRTELQSYLGDIGQDFREDATNTDPAFTRNRIRGRLLPLLREQFNPRVEEALLRLGSQAGEWQELIDGLAAELLEAVILDSQADHVRIDCGAMGSSPRPLVREAFKRLWGRQAWSLGVMSFAHWDQLAGLALEAEDGGAVQLPGAIDARRRGRLLSIACPGANGR